jgi:two-component system nitrate/nitrite response regulator NarL
LTEVTTESTTGAMVEVMVVDDHPGFRKAVRTTLSLDGRCRATAEASSMAEAMSALGQMDHLPDLVVLDVTLGEVDGMRGAAMIADRYPTLPVLLCSTAPLHELPPMPDHAGVSFTPKELLDGDVILDAVERARGH